MLATEYKPGIMKRPLNEKGEWALEQNPNTGTLWALASKLGFKIEWVMSEEPTPDHKRYQGDVLINGCRMRKQDAQQEILKVIKL